VARFAESGGFELDGDRPLAYRYRDFVIKAFNEDLPYDTFVQWQIAGDEIAPDNAEALKATGFLGCGVRNAVITKNQVEKERYDSSTTFYRPPPFQCSASVSAVPVAMTTSTIRSVAETTTGCCRPSPPPFAQS
jgi:hypothetical protein